MRYFIELQYEGAAYCGWQRQPDQRTVQGTIEDAFLAYRFGVDECHPYNPPLEGVAGHRKG